MFPQYNVENSPVYFIYKRFRIIVVMDISFWLYTSDLDNGAIILRLVILNLFHLNFVHIAFTDIFFDTSLFLQTFTHSGAHIQKHTHGHAIIYVCMFFFLRGINIKIIWNMMMYSTAYWVSVNSFKPLILSFR